MQAARESSRLVECGNHLRQLALAVHLHESNHRCLPHNGGADQMQQASLPPGLPSQPQTIEYATGGIYRWGLGDPARSPKNQTGSWLYASLPFLEQPAAYQSVVTSLRPEVVACVSRNERSPSVVADDQNGRYDGGDLVWAKTDYAGNGNAFDRRPQLRRMSDFSGGLSQVVLIGEKAFNPLVQSDSSWLYDESFYLGGSDGTVRRTTELMVDGGDDRFKFAWGSAHPTGVGFALGDGSQRWIVYEIDPAVLGALIQR
ncbi:DUF1559 family PulG-like putative transporter [Rhodopirellula sp. P2]|uniref:DUF1559 family PulG-like putative transporter n=1 Tax=Rhodopirellula sp. P2 TaxID=2127060 RepID=UPI002368B5FD|nr:DUF1559 domain-containing protein [Rhodopirellula sp. P2]WDQ19394.1 DUF1559 domain-containing protein [Rhodopirellula sp. P2]